MGELYEIQYKTLRSETRLSQKSKSIIEKEEYCSNFLNHHKYEIALLRSQ